MAGLSAWDWTVWKSLELYAGWEEDVVHSDGSEVTEKQVRATADAPAPQQGHLLVGIARHFRNDAYLQKLSVTQVRIPFETEC